MKEKLCLILALLFPCFLIGQVEKSSFFFNELNISVNRTVLENDNTQGRFGFGVGLYRYWGGDSWFNMLTGISYDKTSQFKKNVYNGHFSNISDVTYNLHSLSIPLLARFNVGNSVDFFAETGLFLGLNVAANREGTFYSSVPGKEAVTITQKETIKLSNPNGGFLLGFGSNIPIKDYAFVIKFGYQFGIKDLGYFQESIFTRYARVSIGIKKR